METEINRDGEPELKRARPNFPRPPSSSGSNSVNYQQFYSNLNPENVQMVTLSMPIATAATASAHQTSVPNSNTSNHNSNNNNNSRFDDGDALSLEVDLPDDLLSVNTTFITGTNDHRLCPQFSQNPDPNLNTNLNGLDAQQNSNLWWNSSGYFSRNLNPNTNPTSDANNVLHPPIGDYCPGMAQALDPNFPHVLRPQQVQSGSSTSFPPVPVPVPTQMSVPTTTSKAEELDDCVIVFDNGINYDPPDPLLLSSTSISGPDPRVPMSVPMSMSGSSSTPIKPQEEKEEPQNDRAINVDDDDDAHAALSNTLILHEIFGFLSTADLLNARQVNSLWMEEATILLRPRLQVTIDPITWNPTNRTRSTFRACICRDPGDPGMVTHTQPGQPFALCTLESYCPTVALECLNMVLYSRRIGHHHHHHHTEPAVAASCDVVSADAYDTDTDEYSSQFPATSIVFPLCLLGTSVYAVATTTTEFMTVHSSSFTHLILDCVSDEERLSGTGTGYFNPRALNLTRRLTDLTDFLRHWPHLIELSIKGDFPVHLAQENPNPNPNLCLPLVQTLRIDKFRLTSGPTILRFLLSLCPNLTRIHAGSGREAGIGNRDKFEDHLAYITGRSRSMHRTNWSAFLDELAKLDKLHLLTDHEIDWENLNSSLHFRGQPDGGRVHPLTISQMKLRNLSVGIPNPPKNPVLQLVARLPDREKIRVTREDIDAIGGIVQSSAETLKSLRYLPLGPLLPHLQGGKSRDERPLRFPKMKFLSVVKCPGSISGTSGQPSSLFTGLDKTFPNLQSVTFDRVVFPYSAMTSKSTFDVTSTTTTTTTTTTFKTVTQLVVLEEKGTAEFRRLAKMFPSTRRLRVGEIRRFSETTRVIWEFFPRLVSLELGVLVNVWSCSKWLNESTMDMAFTGFSRRTWERIREGEEGREDHCRQVAIPWLETLRSEFNLLSLRELSTLRLELCHKGGSGNGKSKEPLEQETIYSKSLLSYVSGIWAFQRQPNLTVFLTIRTTDTSAKPSRRSRQRDNIKLLLENSIKLSLPYVRLL